MTKGAELVQWLGGLDPEASKAILRKAHQKVFPAETLLYAQGDRVSGIYIVLEGIVKEFASLEGCLRYLRLSGPGDLLGIGEIFSQEPQTLSASTVHQSRLVYLEQAAFQQICMKHPSVPLWMMRQLSARLWELRMALVETVYVESATRLVHRLAAVGERFGEQRSQGTLIDLKLSREEWAALVGIAPETVSRVLHDLERRGWVALEGRKIWLLIDLAQKVA
ncbi:MAG: Crp/Fnr family transcriptional regulator [Candidatus Bipolaricaulota bacterium]|nr:Crp/Fnr family transcriptional regulator [Candidatus Bipolaricaulota bacterium]MDW8031220.1 Crp/Fnr family transcriptional regulator [Candidatus Bipolaricaulota bacterium]